jgi:hypothetical protein
MAVDLPFVWGWGWSIVEVAACQLPPGHLFLMALMVNYNAGLFTTAILLYYLHSVSRDVCGNKAQFLVLGCSIPIISHRGAVLGAAIDDILPPLITVSGSCLESPYSVVPEQPVSPRTGSGLQQPAN